MISRRITLTGPALLALLLALSGCSIYSLPGEQPPPAEPAPREPAVVVPAPSPPPSPAPDTRREEPRAVAAYGPLLDRAQAAADRGDYEEALALLERAQRIDPDSAEIYLAMARTHSARGDAARARATAERGLLYCSGARECDALRRYVR